MKKFTSAIIVAAGNSTRMGLSIPKQLIDLNSKPVLFHTLTAFENADIIDEVVVVARAEDIDSIKAIAENFAKVKAVTVGGDTRAKSVENGTKACSDCAQYFAIHDGARPLITVDDINLVVSTAHSCDCATLGTYVTDTVKVVSGDGVITSTPDRATLRAVQTPQVFEKQIYLSAIDNAVENNLSVTDDCSMVEAIGKSVQVVIGSEENIKLTTQTDLIIAKAILDKRSV